MNLNKIINNLENFSKKYFYKNAYKIDLKKKFPVKILKNIIIKKTIELLIFKKIPSINEYQIFYQTTKYCSNIRNFFLVSVGMVAKTISKYGTTKQKQQLKENFKKNKFLYSLAITEEKFGSDIKSIETNYVKMGNTFIINGKKKWVTLGKICNFFLVLTNGKDGYKFFIINRKQLGIKVKEIKGISNNKASGISEVHLKNVKVTENDILGGISKKKCDQIINFILMNGRAIASVAAISMAEAAFEEAIKYSKTRIQFKKKLYEHQLIQKIIADCKIDLENGKILSEKAMKMKNKLNLDSLAICNIAKVSNSNKIQKITSKLYDIFGANATLSKFNIERYIREARAFQFIEGTSQILLQSIALYALLK